MNVHGDTEGTYIITPHSELGIFQDEIAIISKDEVAPFPLIAVTNLDHAKILHIGKGEIVGFAKPETNSVAYIATTNEINIEEYVDTSPRNWIPDRNRKPLRNQPNSEKSINHTISCQRFERGIVSDKDKCEKSINCSNLEQENNYRTNHSKKSDKSTNRLKAEEMALTKESKSSDKPICQSDILLNSKKEINHSCIKDQYSKESVNWNEINEVIESDFLISPGDIYPNHKVELQDAPIREETRTKFEDVCDHYEEAFSKNNRDIGRTQLIEMEIDTGNSVQLAQSPYTLPLKHYDWVRNKIETLEKAGVIERSFSPLASPVIVALIKLAPDEPPCRRLCVDYRKVNALQQEIKRTNKGTGCLSLYPFTKFDEMFSKLCGVAIFSAIDLGSGYYHIGLT